MTGHYFTDGVCIYPLIEESALDAEIVIEDILDAEVIG
jgi:hypothetical protein